VKLVDNQVKTSSYILPKEERSHFKTPLGKLYKTDSEIEELINTLKLDKNISKIITVGDETTRVILNYSLVPDLAIIDGHIKRKKVELVNFSHFECKEAVNFAGTISQSAWNTIKSSLKMSDTKTIIKITGEEDLLVFPAILESPLGSKVLYGQPNEGLVEVTITLEKKHNVLKLLQKMVKKINGL
jgi:uncharacterized protein (UPF0218 family)